MKYRRLGTTGVYVSELCLGAMTFGTQWEMIGALGQSEADALVGRSLDAGVNFFDTADVYSTGDSEEILGRALAARRRDVVIATKVRGRMGPGPNQVGLSRLHIIAACEASLKRLGTDYIDLYQIHRADPETDVDETLSALTDLVRAGKVRYIGCSNLEAWELMKALGVSERRGFERFQCTQSYYAVAGRDIERDTIPLIRDQGLGLLVWSPLAGGFLSGKFTREGARDADARRVRVRFSRRSTRRGRSTSWTSCTRSRTRTAHRWRRWRWRGCWRRTPSPASSSAPSAWTSSWTTWVRSGSS